MDKVRELMAKRAALLGQADAILKTALDEGRALTAEETTQVDELDQQAQALQATIERADRLAQAGANLDKPQGRQVPPITILKGGLGDNEVKATAAYIKRGDRGALAGLETVQSTEFMASSNDTDMNVTTAADGGVLVPTSHFQGIVAKSNEGALFGPLGVTPYNGYPGTTLNVPIETGGANVFVATAESPGTVDRDAPVLDVAALTYVHFTKSLELTNDLREMEDSQLMVFLQNYIGRALALTHNSALITEVLANGTSVALGDDTAVAAGDVEKMEGALAAEYSDRAYFVMSKATLYKLRALTGNPFLYQATPAGAIAPRQLGESQVFLSSFLAAVGAGNKSLAYADFSYVGMRELPLSFLYDPYSKANTSRVMLHYRTSLVYKVTNADAVLYGQHPTA